MPQTFPLKHPIIFVLGYVRNILLRHGMFQSPFNLLSDLETETTNSSKLVTQGFVKLSFVKYKIQICKLCGEIHV